MAESRPQVPPGYRAPRRRPRLRFGWAVLIALFVVVVLVWLASQTLIAKDHASSGTHFSTDQLVTVRVG